jgi:hypothetical protein
MIKTSIQTIIQYHLNVLKQITLNLALFLSYMNAQITNLHLFKNYQQVILILMSLFPRVK